MNIKTNDLSAAPYLYEPYDGGYKLQIDADQYEIFSDAILTASSSMRIEELFQVFATTIISFEKYLLDVAVDFAYADLSLKEIDDKFFTDMRYQFNVKIITALTALQCYIDHSDRILKYIGNPAGAREFNAKLGSQAFDENFSYRACCQLRNYAQHQSLPLGGFTIGSDADFVQDEKGVRHKVGSKYSVHPWVDILKLKESKKISARFRDELKGFNYNRVDIKWLIRDLARSMYERHAKLRKLLAPEIERANEIIKSGYDLVRAEKNREARHIILCGFGKEHHMRNDLADRVLRDFGSYSSFMIADQIYITSRIQPDAKSYAGQDKVG